MRTVLFALALFVAAPALAATPSGASPDATLVSTFEVNGVPVIETNARVVIRTPVAMTAALVLHDTHGKVVREYADRLLWGGESVLNLDMGDLPTGSYELVVTSRLGTQTISLLIA